MSPRAERWLLLGCLAVAFALRVIGLSYGQPDRVTYHEDTPKQIARVPDFVQGRLVAEDTYPTLHMYVVALLLKALFLLDPHAWDRGPSGLQVVVTARLLNALLGSFMVVLVHLAGRGLFGAPTGLLAALLATLSSLGVLHAHYEMGDVTHTFFVTLAFLAAVRIGLGGGLAWFLLGGVAAGLAGAAKYYGALVLGVVGLAAGFGRRDAWTRQVARLGAAGVAAGLAFVLSTPKLLLTPRGFLAQFGDAFEPIPPPPLLERPLVAGTALLGLSLEWFGPLFLALLALGLVWLARSRTPVALLPLAMPILVFTLYVAKRPHRLDDRNLLIFTPFLFLIVAVALVRLAAGQRWRRLVALGLGAALVGPAALDAVHVAYLFWQDDTRAFAQRWLTRRVPPTASVLTVTYLDSVEAYEATGADLLRLDSKEWLWDTVWYTPRPDEATRRALALLEARGKLLTRFELMPRAFTAPTFAYYDLTSMAVPHAFPPPEGTAPATDSLVFLDEDAVPGRVGILVERDRTATHTLVSRTPLGELRLALSGAGHVGIRQGWTKVGLDLEPGSVRVVAFTPRASFPWFKRFYPLSIQGGEGHVYARVLVTPCEFADPLLTEGRWAEAIPLLERCRDRRVEAPARLLDLARAQAELGRLADARATLEALRRQSPGLLEGLLDLARDKDGDDWRERYRRLAGHGRWFWWGQTVTFQAEEARQRVGIVVEREDAAGGRVLLAEPGRTEPGFLKVWFPQHFLRGPYLVRFRLREATTGAKPVATLSVVRHFQDHIVDVAASQAWSGRGQGLAFEEAVLRVAVDREPMKLEARVFYHGQGTLEIDEVAVLPDVRTALVARLAALRPALGDLATR